jgi:tetratricopeptide (TPR) repeat protein
MESREASSKTLSFSHADTLIAMLRLAAVDKDLGQRTETE